MNRREFLKTSVLVLSASAAGCVRDKRFSGIFEPASNPNEAFTFAVISDCHLGYYKQPEIARTEFAKTVDLINRLSPDLVVCCGDMITSAPHHKTNEEIEEMWDEFDRYASVLKAPLRLACGNHDINTFAGSTESATFDIYTRRYGKTYYSFDHKKNHFIILNTEAVKKTDEMIPLDGCLDRQQFEWLADDLKKSKNAKNRFVFLHRPSWQPVFTSEPAAAFWKDYLHPLFVKNQVDAVFAGHLHFYRDYGTMDGVKYYGLANCGGGKVGYGLKNAAKETLEKSGGWRHIMLIQIDNENWKSQVVLTE